MCKTTMYTQIHTHVQNLYSLTADACNLYSYIFIISEDFASLSYSIILYTQGSVLLYMYKYMYLYKYLHMCNKNQITSHKDWDKFKIYIMNELYSSHY